MQRAARLLAGVNTQSQTTGRFMFLLEVFVTFTFGCLLLVPCLEAWHKNRGGAGELERAGEGRARGRRHCRQRLPGAEKAFILLARTARRQGRQRL